ncbi:unnamed protein product [Adineta ricciae]|uniref:Uncharacterized protein n=1 Tax=Adineta ricciae TaxID=249248 RepID=A0A814S878_ADIRI|nr:unnamed protein product [Adineta ricciae]CAF1547943.1 unnamed protein product [Adineta ricciae]
MVAGVLGDINYLTSTTDGCPAWLKTYSEAASQRSNLVQAPTNILIHDLRGKENSVDLDTNAFEVLKYNGSIQAEFEDDSEEQKRCYKEMEELLEKHLGASRVIVYHHSFRSRGKPRPNEELNDTHRNPAYYPHTDIDDFGAEKLVKRLNDENNCENEKVTRAQIMNIWRLLGSNPSTDKPLAICDYRSIDTEKDVHSLEIRGNLARKEHRTARILSRNAEDAHKWYYLSDIRPDEMFAFKMYDSKPDVAQYAFHTAFHNTSVSALDEEQKSLETRCLVLYYN